MYERLRRVCDTIGIVDNHGHPGITQVNESLPIAPEDQIPFKDKFLPPVLYSKDKPPLKLFAYQYNEDQHYEIYEKFYGFSRQDLCDPDKYPELAKNYYDKYQNLGETFPELMKLSGVDYMMANFFMPDCLRDKENIAYVPIIDGFMYPFDCSYMFYREFSKQYLLQFQCKLAMDKEKYGLPNDYGFDEYLDFVDRAMVGIQAEGTPAVKFAVAYARNLYAANQDHRNPRELFDHARAGDAKEYDAFQDWMFWHLLRQCVKLNLPVQVHTAVTDNYPSYFTPKALTEVLQDPELYDLKLVILHAAYPAFDDALQMALAGKITKPSNVYVDFSGRFSFRNHPRNIADVLKRFWAFDPLWTKTLYGSDVLLGERYLYTAAKTARDASYLAASEMIDDGRLTEDQAITIAKNYLRNNAIRLYKLPLPLA